MSLTSHIDYVQAIDTAQTDGRGKTGLIYSDITAAYLVQGGTLVALTTEDITTLGTYQAPTDASHIRIKELANTDPTKGAYEVHFHDTQLAAAGKDLWLWLTAAGARFIPLHISLFDPNDKTGYVLDATGLDQVSATLGAGVPNTWAKKLLWLVHHFWESSKSTTQILTKDGSGTTRTTQAITDDGNGNQTIGPPS